MADYPYEAACTIISAIRVMICITLIFIVSIIGRVSTQHTDFERLGEALFFLADLADWFVEEFFEKEDLNNE